MIFKFVAWGEVLEVLERAAAGVERNTNALRFQGRQVDDGLHCAGHQFYDLDVGVLYRAI